MYFDGYLKYSKYSTLNCKLLSVHVFPHSCMINLITEERKKHKTGHQNKLVTVHQTFVPRNLQLVDLGTRHGFPKWGKC